MEMWEEEEEENIEKELCKEENIVNELCKEEKKWNMGRRRTTTKYYDRNAARKEENYILCGECV